MSKSTSEKRATMRKLKQWRKEKDRGTLPVKQQDKPLAPTVNIDSLFKKVKRNEIIKPYLSKWDRSRLISLLKIDAQKANIHKIQGRNGKMYWFDEFVNNNLSVIFDLYNLFNLPPDIMRFVKQDDYNRRKFKFIFNSNESNIKIITQGHSLYSYTVMKEIVYTLFQRIVDNAKSRSDEENPNPDTEDSIANFGGDNQQQQRETQKVIKQAIDKASDKIKKMEESGFGRQAGKHSGIENIKENLEILEFIDKVYIDNKILSRFVGGVGRLSTNYFSKNFTEYEVPILDAEEIEEIEGFENFISPLDQLIFDDVTTTRKQYKTGFDLYIDYSGSMNWSINLSSIGKIILKIDLCRITALRLLQENLVQDMFFFDDLVRKIKNKKDLINTNTNGGTNINNVISTIMESGRSGLILTDLEATISLYSPNVFFISFEDYSEFRNSEAGQKYLQNGQCVTFDGDNFEIIR